MPNPKGLDASGVPGLGKPSNSSLSRISPQLLAQLRRLAAKQDQPYQTLIHDLLEGRLAAK
jgi:predicted DNA binding CopG/RHH family protein